MLSKTEFDAILAGDYDSYTRETAARVEAHMAAVHRKARRITCLNVALSVALLVGVVTGSAALLHYRDGYNWSKSFMLLNPMNDPVEVINRS